MDRRVILRSRGHRALSAAPPRPRTTLEVVRDGPKSDSSVQGAPCAKRGAAPTLHPFEVVGNGPMLPREVPAGIPEGPGINPGRLVQEGAAVYKRPLPGTTNSLMKYFIGEKIRS